MDRVEVSARIHLYTGLYGNRTEKTHKQIQNSNNAYVIRPLPVCLL